MIKHEIRDHTAFVTIDNPPANTWTPEGLAALESLVAALEADRGVYALVITGAGPKYFSAGADLKRFQGGKAAAQDFLARFGAAFGALADARFVTIAAINGYAMGGGLECALACDLRIAEAHAQMALPEPAVGLLPAGGGTQALPWLVGEGWAKRMILANERVDAATALRIGLVEEACATGAGLAAATALAARVCALSPRAVAHSKALIHHAREAAGRRAGLALERERFDDLFDHADMAEGIAAFLAKRKAAWKND